MASLPRERAAARELASIGVAVATPVAAPVISPAVAATSASRAANPWDLGSDSGGTVRAYRPRTGVAIQARHPLQGLPSMAGAGADAAPKR